MPNYDYRCLACNNQFETFQHMTDPKLHRCPFCQKNKLERLIGVPAIRTDAEFSKGRGTLLQQFGGDEAEVRRVVSEARKQGYEPNANDIYEPCFAERCGDPKAFLPADNPRAALKKLCAERGCAAEGCGGISIKSRKRDRPRAKQLITS